MIISRMKTRDFDGLAIKMINALGTAPRKGPNMGMMFVTPTMTDTSGAYGIEKI